MSDKKKPICAIISPASAKSNNGNWYTAFRWQRFLEGRAEVSTALSWPGTAADVMIALHARRSADSIARFADAFPDRPLVVVLTGTDLYRDIRDNREAQRSLELATHLVVLQEQALLELATELHPKTRVILQSARAHARLTPVSTSFDFIAVGHLRSEKDPLTLMAAAERLPAHAGIRILHIGDALDEALGDAARHTMAAAPHYKWLGGLPQPRARRWIARSQALVHPSIMEGGAHVIMEAIRSHVPVLASRVSGNIGMLGRDYEGYFPVGDPSALSALMQRFATDTTFAERLRTQCAARARLFDPRAERRAVRQLFREVRAGRIAGGKQ